MLITTSPFLWEMWYIINTEYRHIHKHEVELCWGLFLFLTAARITGCFCLNQSANGSLDVSFYCSQEEPGRNKRLRREGGKKLKGVEEGREEERSDHLLQWREFNCTSNWRRCHTGWTNRRQRNGATYDINAGLGWELPAWGSFPMSRQTEWAYSDTPVQKHNPDAFCFIIHVWLIFFFHSHSCRRTDHWCTQPEKQPQMANPASYNMSVL